MIKPSKITDIASSSSSLQKVEELPKKKIFSKSQVKSRFYSVAKQGIDNGEIEETAMRKYYECCNKNKIAALPIFSKIQEGKCSIIGYFINNSQAIAIGGMLEALSNSKKMFFDEINLDYNGLKDEQFYLFLKALQ